MLAEAIVEAMTELLPILLPYRTICIVMLMLYKVSRFIWKWEAQAFGS